MTYVKIIYREIENTNITILTSITNEVVLVNNAVNVMAEVS